MAGIAIGLTGVLALGRAVSTHIFGVTVRNPATFAAVATLLAAVALAACVIPDAPCGARPSYIR